jgi:hypothetical protein
MQAALFISLWAYLFCVPLAEPGQVFGWLKYRLFKWIQPDKSEWREMIFNPLIGCAKCHAGQVAFWWQVWNWHENSEFSLPFVLGAIAGAYALQTWHLMIDKWLNK